MTPQFRIRFSANWPDLVKIHGGPRVFSFVGDGDTVREALCNALETHHTFVAPLFDEEERLVIPSGISLWLYREKGQIPLGGNSPDMEMLDWPIEQGWHLSIDWNPDAVT